MPIFFFRGKTATDMALRLVEIQYFSYLLCQRGIDVAKAVGDIFMYRRLRHPKFFCALPYRRFRLDDIFCDFHCPLFDIILHVKKPPKTLFLQCMRRLSVIMLNTAVLTLLLPQVHPLDRLLRRYRRRYILMPVWYPLPLQSGQTDMPLRRRHSRYIFSC